MAQAMVLLSCGTLFADYIEDRAAAVKLMRSRKYEEALETLRKMKPHDRVGFCFHTAAKTRSVRVYVKATAN